MEPASFFPCSGTWKGNSRGLSGMMILSMCTAAGLPPAGYVRRCPSFPPAFLPAGGRSGSGESGFSPVRSVLPGILMSRLRLSVRSLTSGELRMTRLLLSSPRLRWYPPAPLIRPSPPSLMHRESPCDPGSGPGSGAVGSRGPVSLSRLIRLSPRHRILTRFLQILP